MRVSTYNDVGSTALTGHGHPRRTERSNNRHRHNRRPPASTRPPENNEQVLRPLTPEEIPPNLNFYAMDPLYKAGTPLGWATERIRETLDRGVVAMVARGGLVHLSWRLLDTDPRGVGFNVYRRTAAGETKLTPKPLVATTGLRRRG